jgi:hypothetical protein
MPRSPDQSPRWPSDRRPLALRADDFDPRRSRRASEDLSRRLDAWARDVVRRLASLGVDATAHVVAEQNHAEVRFVAPRASDAARLAGSDADGTRLVLRLEPTSVRAGLELPAPRARAARVRLADPARALELATALEVLPEQFTMGDSSEPRAGESPRASADDLRVLLERVERAGGESADAGWAWVGWTVPRVVALEHAAMLDEQLEDAIAALGQLFALLVAGEGETDDRGPGKGRRFSGRRAGEGKASRKRDDEDERNRGRDLEARARGRGRDREPEADGEEAEAEPVGDALAPGGRAHEAKVPARSPRLPRLASRRRSTKASQVAIERGARVRVLKGPFAGKVGVVHELDGKGGARVMLGLLAVRLDVTNLMPCVERHGRPVLSSSHRKPIPARS